ncbi:hypothetical protein Daus18300_012052 [Diaporthe australafricana]|uniref:Ankyrin repeat protein n=1 Tax=Diaporthe australafricana TaxID=127596 RepID=A0ABR3W4B2_9PEZI
MPIIEVSSQVVDSDIQIYRLRKWTGGLRTQIQESLNKGSQGMFRWVSCQLQVIANCINARDLTRALNSLPRSLTESYTSVLANIEECYREYAFKILLWLAVSPKPLRIQDAADVLSIDFEADNGPLFDPDLRVQDFGDIISICSTLVTPIKAYRGCNGITVEFTELCLAHHTVKEYLLSDVFKAKFPQPVPFTDQKQVHGFVAKTSIAYLLSLHEPATPTLLNDRPLSRLAAEIWLHHYLKAGSSSQLTGLAMQLLASDGDTEPYKNWCRLYDLTRPWRQPSFERERFPDPLYYTSSFGVERLVSELLERGADLTKKGEVHQSCLQAAAYHGHYRVAEILLQAGADPDDVSH